MKGLIQQQACDDLEYSSKTTFDELEYILCEELGFLGRTEYKLHIYFKLITVNFGERSETVLPIKKDRDLKKFFNPRNGYASIDVFVEAEKLPENTELGYPGVGEWGTYMSMLTQDLPSLPVVTEAMGGFGLDENYSGSSSYATPSNYAGPSDNAGPSSNVGQSNYAGPPSNAGTSAYNEEDDDPEGDSLLYNESSESEPDEVEEEDQMPANHENDDEVSIDIMMDVLGNNADAPTTPAGENFDLNMPTGSVPPYNLYPVPAFFRTTHPEIPADSIDVPTGNWGHFYDSNTGELALGMVFKSKDHLKASVQDFSVRHARREYRVVESNPKLWKVCCKWDVETGCNWMLRGIFKSNMRLFKITRYAGPHTCLMNEVSVDHGNLGKSMIATHLMGMVREDPTFAIKNVRQTIKDKFGFEIPYHKAWQALKAAREQIYGTWESSVQKLPRYKHKLLVAVTLDANNQVLPLAFALVDEETLASWTWFLQMLARHFLPNEDDRVCLISDRHPGLINAINYVPAFKFPRGVHRFCLRHVCSNFNNKYKNVQLKDLCWRAGSESSARKFDRIMEEIKSLNPEAYDWLGNIDKTQWTLAHDGGWRTGILTTNMSEAVNGVLKGARRLPIVPLVEITLNRSAQYFLQRTARANRMVMDNQQWADYAFRFLRQDRPRQYITSCRSLIITNSASVITLSTTGQGSRTYVVKLRQQMCSCGKWATHGIPCSHAIQASRHFGMNASNFIPEYFSTRAYKKTYLGRFEPVYGEEYWDPVHFELVHNPTKRTRRGPGRDVTTRIRNEMDQPQRRARQQYQAHQT
ncbi:UNVERIFIED_CONTAM: hypothetical protein Sradi_3698100 [Sesamum radiatum]|uniref:SWIM-type domain-containing protein n=1 Tax=Sesamum radiatum TaxID=300843 RepID=A0AAW2PXP3_SESRA